MTKEQALNYISREFDVATEKFGRFNSSHEGLAVIEEEFLELRNEVFWGQLPANKRAEAIQLGAMALRFLVDLCKPI